MGKGTDRVGSSVHTHKQWKELNGHDGDHNDRKNDCNNKINLSIKHDSTHFIHLIHA